MSGHQSLHRAPVLLPPLPRYLFLFAPPSSSSGRPPPLLPQCCNKTLVAVLRSLLEALRASRASVLEKPISTNLATCRDQTQPSNTAAATPSTPPERAALPPQEGGACSKPALLQPESCPAGGAAWTGASGPGGGAAPADPALCASGRGTICSSATGRAGQKVMETVKTAGAAGVSGTVWGGSGSTYLRLLSAVPPGFAVMSQQHLLVQQVHPLLPLDLQGGAHPQRRLLAGLGALATDTGRNMAQRRRPAAASGCPSPPLFFQNGAGLSAPGFRLT